MRILVVESDSSTVDALEAAFPGEHEIVHMSSGMLALERIAVGRHFDVVFCEVDPPDITAREICECLDGASPRTTRALVLVLSELKPHRALLDQKARRFLLRPVTPATVRDVIAAVKS